jgi:hypothetical protein
MDHFIDDLPVTIEIFHSYVSLPEVIHQMNKFFSAKHESTKWVVLYNYPRLSSVQSSCGLEKLGDDEPNQALQRQSRLGKLLNWRLIVNPLHFLKLLLRASATTTQESSSSKFPSATSHGHEKSRETWWVMVDVSIENLEFNHKL